jgi:hypothetical protein
MSQVFPPEDGVGAEGLGAVTITCADPELGKWLPEIANRPATAIPLVFQLARMRTPGSLKMDDADL